MFRQSQIAEVFFIDNPSITWTTLISLSYCDFVLQVVVNIGALILMFKIDSTNLIRCVHNNMIWLNKIYWSINQYNNG